MRYVPRCETFGAWGHNARECALRRLNEQQEALGPRLSEAKPVPESTNRTYAARPTTQSRLLNYRNLRHRMNFHPAVVRFSVEDE
jgi:hypothetical protein